MGMLGASCHFGCAFGAVGSVWGFHRVESMLTSIARRGPKLCIVRHVDDYLGVDLEGVQLHAGYVFHIITAIVGILIDGAKGISQASAMTVFAIYTQMQFRTRRLIVQVQEEKAKRWRQCLQEVLDIGVCSAGCAAKQAGRLSSLVASALNNVGRAMVKHGMLKLHSQWPEPRQVLG